MSLEKEAEKKIIERGLQIYFTCKLCEELHWNIKCTNKEECGKRLYKLLKWHYEKGETNGNN